MLTLTIYTVLASAGEQPYNDECPLCLTEFDPNDDLVLLSCDHGFHQACALEAPHAFGLCPNCRQMLNDNPVVTKHWFLDTVTLFKIHTKIRNFLIHPLNYALMAISFCFATWDHRTMLFHRDDYQISFFSELNMTDLNFVFVAMTIRYLWSVDLPENILRSFVLLCLANCLTIPKPDSIQYLPKSIITIANFIWFRLGLVIFLATFVCFLIQCQINFLPRLHVDVWINPKCRIRYLKKGMEATRPKKRLRVQ